MEATTTQEIPARKSAARTKPSDSGGHDVLTKLLIEALVFHRGAAHRDTVIEYVDIHWRRQGRPTDHELPEKVEALFEKHRADRSGGRQLFFLPFGPGSHRWSLTKPLQMQFLSRTV
ncbi:MAG: hypothetical protein ACXWVJ_04230 [Caulobacteraceae bacterium]